MKVNEKLKIFFMAACSVGHKIKSITGQVNGKSQNERMALTGKYDNDLLGHLGFYPKDYNPIH